jgi:hypothetical protein
MLNEGNDIHHFYCVFVRTFVIPFYYGSGTIISYGSGSNFLTKLRFRFRFHTAKSYGSYGSDSGSTTLK